MIRVGDTVKVIGTTSTLNWSNTELIPIGSVCEVIVVTHSADRGTTALIQGKGTRQYWYPISALERGHLEWVKDEDEDTYSTSTIWLVSGTGLITLEIVANSFDDAIAQARKIDTRYNTGQVKEIK